MMKISELYEEIMNLKSSLPHLFDGAEIEFPFKDSTVPIGQWSEHSTFGIVITNDGIGSKSGVYFFAKPCGEVFYIGKAAKLHGRIWNHVNTPGPVENGKRQFPAQTFRSDEALEEIRCVQDGTARLGVATVSKPELVSLIEVFLHTIHLQKYGKLPAFNKRIG
jgi:hypothetical protein